MTILKNRKWGNDIHKVHFESGVRMGIGAFNLVRIYFISTTTILITIISSYIFILKSYTLFQMISLLPARIIKLLEFIGFSGDKVIKIMSLLSY